MINIHDTLKISREKTCLLNCLKLLEMTIIIVDILVLLSYDILQILVLYVFDISISNFDWNLK